MINAATKDQILFYLCACTAPEKYFQTPTNSFLKEVNVDFDTFYAIMCQFQRLNLVSDLNLRRSHSAFVVSLDAHDYAQKGGFVLQEEVFKTNLHKLELEIDHLKKQLGPDQLDTLNKLSTIAAALFSGLAILPKG